MLKNIRNTLLIAVYMAVLVACGSGGSGTHVRPQNEVAKTKGLALYAEKNYFAATDWLSQYWSKHPDDVEAYVALLDAWQQLGEVTQVWKLLNESDIQAAEVEIIEAELASQNQHCDESVAITKDINHVFLSEYWQPRYWLVRAQCLAVEKQHLAAVEALVQVEAYLADELNIQAHHDQIVNHLLRISEAELILAIGNSEYDAIMQGWLEAAYVNFGADGVSGEGWLQQWIDHPASSYFLDLNQVNSQQKVAVLLPFSGRFNAVAKAVQKGLLAAAVADTNNQNDLLFYDTGSQAENTAAAWYAAQENQADMIIGPLDKASIDAVELLPAATIPVVMLNQTQANYFQFTLSPEGEAEQAAERMINDGNKRVLILAPNDAWGERMTTAFAQRFVDWGGQIITNTYFQPAQNDYSAQLRQTLGLVESQLRAKNLQGFLNLNLSSEEVVRSDIDAIFLAAKPSFARLMVPQLKFHHAANIPVYATSHVFDGMNNEQHNRDLQGVRFALSPIEMNSSSLQEVLPFDTQRINTDKQLFSLGYDAYQLISRLGWMSRVNTGVIEGLTGKVTLGLNGHFKRGLSWAEYNNGSIIALPE